jgi:hypothetical protein
MSADDDAGTLLDAVDTLQKVRELIDGLRMAGQCIFTADNRDRGNAIVYLATLARDHLDEAEHKIEGVRRGLKPTEATS